MYQVCKPQGIIFHAIVVKKNVGRFPLNPPAQPSQIRISVLVVIAGDSVQPEVLKVSILGLVFERVDTVA